MAFSVLDSSIFRSNSILCSSYYKCLLLNTLLIIGIISCAHSEDEIDQTDSIHSGYLIQPDGKFDTGYYSNLALELEGDFKASLVLPLTGLDEQERLKMNDPGILRIIAEQQVKMAKSQLNEKSLHLNLTSDEIQWLNQFTVQREEGEFLVVEYSIVAESLVTFKELKEQGLDAKDLENTSHDVLIPEDPRDLFTRVGEACAEGFEIGSLRADNYFYYFAPNKSTCKIPMSMNASFHVRSLLPQTETFPEYDRLTADQEISLAVIFGAYTSDDPPGSDWGVMMWRSYEVDLRLTGWKKVDGAIMGQRYTRTQKNIRQVMDLVSPNDLYAMQDTNQAFAQLIKNNEIIVYNGHSFYGSLDALESAQSYPQDTYQILFMNSCWSYEYYTKQVFANKVTADDARGWQDVDVVNNTTYAYFPQMSISTIKLVSNLLAGAGVGGADQRGRRFSWQNIIGIMNDQAQGICPEDADPRDCRGYIRKTKHEIYGVSGVRDNQFQPKE